MKQLKTGSLLLFLQGLFLLCLPIQYGPHFWQQNLLLSGFRIDYLSAYIYPSDILAIIIIFLGPFFIKRTSALRWPTKLTFFLFLYNLGQLLWVEQRLAHFIWSIRIWISLMVFLQIYELRKGLARYIMPIVMVQSLVIALLVVLQFLHQGSIGGLWYFLGERSFSIQTPGIAKFDYFGQVILRPYAMFSHPNTLAGYMLLLGYIGLIYCRESYAKVQKAIILGLVCLVVTLSFSELAWIALILLISGSRVFNRIKTIQLPILLVSILMIVISPLMMNLFDFNREDLMVRNQILENTRFKYLWNIIFGSGWFGSIVSKLSYVNIGLIQPIHNSLWEVLYSLGALPIVSMIIIIIKKISNLHLIFSSNEILGIVLLCVLISYDHYLVTQAQTLYLVCFYILNIFIQVESSSKIYPVK